MPSETILTVNDLCVKFGDTTAVENVSFKVTRGQTLAIVGESGSGKSVTSLATMGLLRHLGGKITSGSITLHDQDGSETEITTATDKQLRDIRGNSIGMVFQEPMTSLDPVFTVGNQITEALRLHRGLSGQEARKEAARLLDMVRLPNAERQLDRYPHQLSGGMRQRVMIAMALSCSPDLLICDEPTTALDVTIQAQVLQIIRDMQKELGTSVIFISHDMGVVSQMADEIVVMRHGHVVEKGDARDVINSPADAYTVELMAAVPKIGTMKGRDNPRPFDLPGQPAPDIDHPAPDLEQPLVRLEGLTTHYNLPSGLLGRVRHRVHAAEEISFDIHPGETLALVGESGSGKSTVGKTLQQLVPASGGRILFRGTDILALNGAEQKRFKREIQYVFQDPYGSLNPRKTIRASLAEPMAVHGLLTDRKGQIDALMEAVGLKPEQADRYPHEFSGGQRQRIAIARALAVEPHLIIADEAVSALDVSVQAQVINLMMDLQAQRGLSYLFISHDMAVVERVSHRVAVMYLGQIVEIGTRRQIFENPQHPYTKRLLEAVPVVSPGQEPPRVSLSDDIPSPIRHISNPPVIHTLTEIAPGHLVADGQGAFL